MKGIRAIFWAFPVIFLTGLQTDLHATFTSTTCEPDSGCYVVDLVGTSGENCEESGTKFTYKVTVKKGCKDLSHWCIDFDGCADGVAVTSEDVWGDIDFECKTEENPDPTTGCVGLKIDEELDAPHVHHERHYEFEVTLPGCWCTEGGTFYAKAGSCDPTSGAVGVPGSDDGDGVCGEEDQCPDDPEKTDPGVCGCGVADTDTDEDGAADCEDGCVEDSNKINPGVCGCGVSDVDADEDGTPDCNDNCPGDPDKIEEGVCGCGEAESDSDTDETLDCEDTCPFDPFKTDPSVCGCGVADTDADTDGTADCEDGCAEDAAKTNPGVCGCGVSDIDSDEDGTPDCNDDGSELAGEGDDAPGDAGGGGGGGLGGNHVTGAGCSLIRPY